MGYCDVCGTKLITVDYEDNQQMPYCTKCQRVKYPSFDSVVSVILFHPHKDKILLVKQYGLSHHLLVAGHIDRGENAKQALIREVREEVNLNVVEYEYNDNEYYEKGNILIHNYAAVAESENYRLNNEVDEAGWYDIADVLDQLEEHSLPRLFVERYLRKKNLIDE